MNRVGKQDKKIIELVYMKKLTAVGVGFCFAVVVLLPGREVVGWIEREVLGLCLDIEPRVILGDLDSSGSSGEKNSVGRKLAAYLGIKSAGSGLRLLGICRTPRCPPK